MKKEKKCPCCKGAGTITTKEYLDRPARREKARVLRKYGFTYREIMNAVGYKSLRSVSLALNRKD